ncbi:MAG: Hint domain-containing protein [Paracoccaceae bacterium]
MVLRSFFAQDSTSLIVTSSSDGSIVGNPIVNNSSLPDGTVFQYSSGTGTTVTLDDTVDADVFGDDNPSNHVITDGGGIVADGVQVEAESRINMRALDDDGNPTGPQITVYVFSQGGLFSDVWGYATNEPLQDGTSYVKVSGSNFGSSAYSSFVACFGEGTHIETSDGDRMVQTLAPGQKVWTRGKGFQPVRWVGNKLVEGRGALAPVVIEQGVIGNTNELVLSQQHRVLVTSPRAEMLFGQDEVFVAAKHLCGIPGISVRERETVRYFHLMFDRHHVIRSNGALTESFFLERNAVDALSAPQRTEILSLFPELGRASDGFGATAVMTIGAREAAVLRNYL